MALSRKDLARLSGTARKAVEAQLDRAPLTKGVQLGKRVPKYRNKRNEGWDSKAERRYYEHLQLREMAGEIANLRRQVRVDLHVGRRYMRIDFVYDEDGRTVYDDFKGFATRDWQIKADLWAAGAGPGLLRITKRKGGKYVHTDIAPRPNPDLLARMLAHADAKERQ